MSCDFAAIKQSAGEFEKLSRKQLLMVQAALVKDLSGDTSSYEDLKNSSFNNLSTKQLRMVITKLACDVVGG